MNKSVVAHINHTFFAGSETFIYHYISNLQHFHPICLCWGLANLKQFPFPQDDMYSLALKRYTLKWLFYGGLKKIFNRDFRAEKIIKGHKARLIHAHFGPFGVYAINLKKVLGIPLITSFYGFDISQLPQKKEWIERYKILFQESNLFFVEGPYMKSQLVVLGCPEKKIQIQRIAIPLDKIPFRPRKPKAADEKVILIFAGRFVEKKGLLYALAASRMVYEKYKNFEFRIIGDGRLKPAIEKFIKNNRMVDYVKLLGFLTYENYLKEMQQADIFIHPSITASDGDSEGGAPTTILEAQAMGMPVVTTYHADIPNIVVPNTSALLSNEKDMLSLSQNITYLLENQDIWGNMGSVGREFVYTYHDIRKEVNALEKKYNSLL